MANDGTRHPWRFSRTGGFDQVLLRTGADLMALGSLDQKLWVALACPTSSLEFDSRTLRLLDVDGDGRVRAPELISGCEWAGRHLVDVEELTRGTDELKLAHINRSAPEGAAICEATAALLKTLGKDATSHLTVDEASGAVDALFKSPLNGDGVITEATAPTDDLKACLRDIIDCVGAEPDRSRVAGVTQKKIDQFFADVALWTAWQKRGEADATLCPDGARTTAVRQTLRKVEAKIDDYFARCQIAAFDPRSASHLNRDEKDYSALALRQLRIDTEQLADFPIAHIEAGRPLPLSQGLNPGWESAVQQLKTALLDGLFPGCVTLTQARWESVKARYAPYDDWMAKREGAAVEKLGAAKVAAYLTSELRLRLSALVQADLALAPSVTALASVEKLARFRRDLFKLANNFVSFRDFFSRETLATFQAGKLYIDQRSCDLVLRVEDTAKHAVVAGLARTYVVYCDCTRDGKKITIAAAVTAGDSDNLMVGRNGVFYDRQGRDWDATITRIIDNPISVRQAFWAPYKKVLRFIEEQVARRASEADTAANGKLTATASELGSAAETGTAPQKERKLDIGVVAALGVAVGGIAAATGAMTQAFFGLGIWMPLGLLALLLAISGPSMAIAWLKLRQRNLAPMLDANGWAMNSPARINIPFGNVLTQTAALPRGASRELRDPFAEPRRAWGSYAAVAALLVLAVFWLSGRADPYLPDRAQRASVWAARVAVAPEKVPAAPNAPVVPPTGTAAQTPP